MAVNQIKSSVLGLMGKIIGIYGNVNVNVNSTQYDNNYLDEFVLTPSIETFKGRQNEIEELYSFFCNEEQKKFWIYGLPGFGKSELAKQFAHFCLYEKNKIKRAFWIPCENKNDLKSLSSLLKEIYRTCENDDCLFIFDGPEESICELMPHNKKYFLLITSSQSKDEKNLSSLKLDPLSPDAAIEVIQSILNEDDYKEKEVDLYKQLLNIVENVPLGVQIIGKQLREDIKNWELWGQEFLLKEYVKKQSENHTSIFLKEIYGFMDNKYSKSIYKAMQMSLDKIKYEIEDDSLRILTISILYVCSYMNQDLIYFKDLMMIPNIKNQLNEYNYIEDIIPMLPLNVLFNFSFLNFVSKDKPVSMLRFTQKILIYHLSTSEPSLQSEIYMSCLQFIFSVNDIRFKDNHTESVLKYADDNEDNVNTVHKFYKQEKDISENIFETLIKHGCIECIKKIVNESTQNEFFYKYLELAKEYKQEEICKFINDTLTLGLGRLRNC